MDRGRKRTALKGFASRLERDLEAANAALTLPWSHPTSKAKCIDSSSSSDRCTVARGSISCASACSSRPDERRFQTLTARAAHGFTKCARQNHYRVALTGLTEQNVRIRRSVSCPWRAAYACSGLRLGRDHRVLGGLGQTEFHRCFSLDLDRFAGLRVASDPGCTLRLD